VLNDAASRGRTIAAASDGALFSIQIDAGNAELSLTHFPAGTDTGTSLTLPPGNNGSVAAATGSVAVYLYTTTSNEVAVGVEAF
jgi:hypothetical protein